MAWINSNWGLLLACCAAVGAVGTVVGVRLRASRIGRRLRGRVETGELVWGAQVRRRLAGRRWGPAGDLTLNFAGELRFEPFPSDLKRGAKAETWAEGQARIAYGERRRDITGITFHMLVLTPEEAMPQEYAATDGAGALPAEWTI